MAKKDAYFWRGKGDLKIDKPYVPGSKIPHEKMDKGTFDKMVKDGRIQKTAFDVVESSLTDDLEKQVKDLSEKLVECNKRSGGDNCKGCNAAAEKIAGLETEIKRLTGELEEATKPADKKKD